MLSVQHRGSFSNTLAFLNRAKRMDISTMLDSHGAAGVRALEQATPVDKRETAQSWSYKVTRTRGRIKIAWYNSHADGATPVAILIQYGHATRNGGWVEGRDFINPAMKPIFDKIATDVWKEVNR